MQVTENFGSQVHQIKSSFDKSTGPFGQEVSALAYSRNDSKKEAAEITPQQSLNLQIVQTSLEVSFATGNDSLSLLLKTATEELNGILEAELGVSLEQAYQSDLDISPNATAGRIVSLSTGFFSAFQDQHPELDLETAVTEFTDLIKGGIDNGFVEVRAILEGLSVLDGDIAANVDETYGLVRNKLQTFIEGVLATK